MRFIIDTHIFLWALTDDDKLSKKARLLVEDVNHQLVISIASLWEMAVKVSIGKLEQKRTFTELIEISVRGKGIELLPIMPAHLDAVATLPLHHRDPFDRLIIAQGVAETLPILTNDKVFAAYPIKLL